MLLRFASLVISLFTLGSAAYAADCSPVVGLASTWNAVSGKNFTDAFVLGKVAATGESYKIQTGHLALVPAHTIGSPPREIRVPAELHTVGPVELVSSTGHTAMVQVRISLGESPRVVVSNAGGGKVDSYSASASCDGNNVISGRSRTSGFRTVLTYGKLPR